MSAGARWRGSVADPAGRAVPGALVSIVESSVPMPEVAIVADAAGAFVLNLPPGHFVLQARTPAGGIGEARVDSPGSGTIAIVVPD